MARSSAQRHRRRARGAHALLVIAALAVVGCDGTTEARTNEDLQPGSGDLGEGDVPADPEQTGEEDASVDEAQPEDEDDAEDLDAEAASTTAPAVTLHQCGTPEAADAIEVLPRVLAVPGHAPDERAAAVQYGDDPDVGDLLRPVNHRVDAAVVTGIECVDDGSATIEVVFRTGDVRRPRGGSVMMVDGSWRVTLASFCDWQIASRCDEDMRARAAAALSPALRDLADA